MTQAIESPQEKPVGGCGQRDEVPIPVEDLERARRRLKRSVAACLVQAMAETDVGFDGIAAALGVSEKAVRKWFMCWLDGTANDLNQISDLAFALRCEFRVSLTRLPELSAPKNEVTEVI